MGNENLVIHQFNSTQRFWDAVLGEETVKKGRSSRSGDFSFTGTNSFEEAMQLARFGWEEGVKLIKPLAARISAAVGRYIPDDVPRHDVTGAFVDVGAFLNGQPEDMITFDEELRKGKKLVRVVYNCSASCCVDKEILARRGAVALAMIEGLQKAGLVAELVVGEYVSRGSKKFGFEVSVKRSDEPINMNRVAFAVAHPSMLRRCAFAFEETLDASVRDAFGFHSGGGYGSPADFPADRHGDVYFGKMYGGEPQWASEESATKAALDELIKLGVVDKEAAAHYGKSKKAKAKGE